MLAAALSVVGGFGVGGCAYALRLQNDCFVWLCAPVSAPRPRGRCARLSAACAALCSRGCCGWCAHSGGCNLFCLCLSIFFASNPLTRALHCDTIIDAPTEVVALQHYSITKRRDLSSPVFLFFRRRARGKTPRPP